MTSSRSRTLAFLLVLACALVVWLGFQNARLQERNALLARRATEPYAGMLVPTFHARTLEGETLSVGGGSGDAARRQVLFFFTTTCPYCEASLPAVQRIAAHLADTGEADLIGVALDSIGRAQRYAQENALAYRVVTLPEPKLARIYRATQVPTVLVVDRDGLVLQARVGLLREGPAVDSLLAAARARRPTPQDSARARLGGGSAPGGPAPD